MADRSETYYDLLGVPFGASAEAIKLRYRELAKQYHPDVNPSPEAERRMRLLNEAYRTLTTPHLRLAYDLRLLALRRLAQPAPQPFPYLRTKPVSPPVPAYLSWLLGGVFMLIVGLTVVYTWLHPYKPKEAELRGYGFMQLPPYLRLSASLRRLDLSHNKLSALPPGLWTLSHVEEADFSHNRLTVLPSGITHWAFLRRLRLGHNRLRVLPRGLGDLRFLTHLELQYNELIDLPLELYTLPNLRYLDVRGNPLSDSTRARLRRWASQGGRHVVGVD
ncbi:MAG: DnaJ domain-containing protein [Bacteroidia bacterium]|nr:DnaJ domain-containing protein [Bacteroidia bacterium]MDW8088393.1 DnaJ domain-containing protein [Bacteroidia bacterium]